MKEFFTLSLLCLGVLFYSSPIFAEDYSERIKKIAELYESMEYEKCLQQIREIEQYTFSMTKEELIDVYKYKAFIYILSDREALAENVIRDIYSLDPDFTLSPSISPKLRKPFAKIKKEIKKEGREGSAPKVIEATVVGEKEPLTGTELKGKVEDKREKNFFMKNIIPISLGGAGLVLNIVGLIVRLDAASEASDYRERLENAHKDELGNIIGITRDEAKSKQDEIDRNVLIGNSLITVGSLTIVGGVVTYFVLPKLGKNGESGVSVMYNGDLLLVAKSMEF